MTDIHLMLFIVELREQFIIIRGNGFMKANLEKIEEIRSAFFTLLCNRIWLVSPQSNNAYKHAAPPGTMNVSN